ncbi:zinc finger CCCH domain-containing protein 17-like [Zingiber officinale]|uniref:zinc finger CCCH domain-containing protein 17-like n=1 Tax=Zingiber officinale TaxID=94328 RepID=UPI001C4C9465|nr:zinc finger CCCH domain-containing protein 17-like [Zingiber officinale]
MDFEQPDRYGNRRAYQRAGPSQVPDRSNKVCFHWQAGRCSRHPCPFLHSDPPQTVLADGAAKRGHLHGHVSRNPASAGAPPSKWGKGRAGGKAPDKICNYFLAGNCSFGDRCRFLHSWFMSDSFSLLTQLQGHQKVVTGIALPSGSDKLYSCSKDESVRVWDTQTGKCVGAINMGGEVGCMISEGPWLFIGVANAVKAWNTQTTTEQSLDGPVGQVYALTVGNGMLFAGTQDARILVWKFSAAGNVFEPATSLSDHRHAVVSLVAGAMKLYSGSMDNTIKVWDLATFQCLQTLSGHTSVVMSVLCWDKFLLSSSLDNTIKVWVLTDAGNLEVAYTHEEEHGVLALCGMLDAEAKPVILCSCNDNSIRVYDLPSFGERGRIFSKQEMRAIQVGPGGLFFTGDGTGELKVWQWSSKQNN